MLFSGDEEKGGTCIRAFLDSEAARGLERAIVCEPTGCRVGARHRGIGAAEATLPPVPAVTRRASTAWSTRSRCWRAPPSRWTRWGARCRGKGPPGFQGICLNVAALDGGIAFNVVPTQATLLFSVRPAPGVSASTPLLAEAERRVRAATRAARRIDLDRSRRSRPPLQTRDLAAFEPLLGGARRAAVDLDFWTEAALLAERGIDAVVFGPGDIGQAHAADEYVELAELETAPRRSRALRSRRCYR